ncbi:MAG: 2-amino-4-hydroxy-6-hydroxymethyldihydropteridine diphosphokinase [Proteobacteria bacterium]|nr:2-amino-4-hydroxy-6-hydroxymethyldihydropteridine diphosphokinase [Pseudomonadota bacterium]
MSNVQAQRDNGSRSDSAEERRKTRLKRIIFGLGSNLGDRESYLGAAVVKLERELFLSNLRKSKIFKNPAMLLPNSPQEWDVEFFNIALSADVDLEKFSPEKILEIAKKIEKNLGRKKRAKWAPREIDIDILAIGDLRIQLGEKLIIPHPGLKERDFFVQTVSEIEPDLLALLKIS